MNAASASTKRGGPTREMRVQWLQAEASQAERDIQRLVTVLAKRRKGRT